jgi:hypothetical protein
LGFLKASVSCAGRASSTRRMQEIENQIDGTIFQGGILWA